MTRQAVITLNNKFYVAYPESELQDAQKRARQLKDGGKQVTLKWMSQEAANELQIEEEKEIEAFVSAKTEFEEAKKTLAHEAYTWGRIHPMYSREAKAAEDKLKKAALAF